MTAEELKKLEDTLWESATQLRNASGLKSNEYATPVLGIIFLKFADNKYRLYETEINTEFEALQKTRRFEPEKAPQQLAELAIARCGFYLPDVARYEYLLTAQYKTQTTENEPMDAREALRHAMRQMEELNSDLRDTLPINEFDKIPPDTIQGLLKTFAQIPLNAGSDVFGKIYEYFLGEFALAEGQKGGEFFTPTPVVELMVEVIEPKGGKLLDPACGSGGMFVHSGEYVQGLHPEVKDLGKIDFVVYGQEKTRETMKLAKMNIAINGIRGQIMEANTFNDDYFESVENFDYVLANPPFNVKDVKTSSVENQTRFNHYGLPKNQSKGKKDEDYIPNANYLWISLFATALKPKGRAGLVMANSASDARGSEYEIRKRMIESGVIEAMLTLSSNMFNTVTLPATLWFFEKPEKGVGDGGDAPFPLREKLLFVDARNVFTQLTRKQRTFTPEQIQNIATIFRLYRGENQRFIDLIQHYEQEVQRYEHKAHIEQSLLNALQTEIVELEKAKKDKELKTKYLQIEKIQARQKEYKRKQAYFLAQIKWLQDRFPEGKYQDVTGLCKVATLAEIEEQDYSLNPGRYVGVVIEEDGLTAEEFKAEMLNYHTQLAQLNAEAYTIEAQIMQNFKTLF